jgi:hypothetical protein
LEPGGGSWEKLLVQLLQFDASRDFQLFQEVCAVVIASMLFSDAVFCRLEVNAMSLLLCV